jgi:thiosulfate reductase / polysulfide reductase chain A
MSKPTSPTKPSKTSRRTFLKISGASIIGGAAAYWFSGGSNGGESFAANLKEIKADRIVPTFCEICFWKCGVLAHVKDGKVFKLEGNPKHPLSNGKLCPRGTGGTGALYDPDRLKTPLIRSRVDGKEVWKAVSWDEALTYTAKRLNEVKAKHGAEAIALYSHGHGGAFFKTIMKGLGSGVMAAPSFDQCRGARTVGFKLTYGRAVGSLEQLDTPNSKCIAFIGSHLGENMHNTAVQDLSQAIDRGASLITVDPRFSVVASKSKYWLPIKPGTDIALLLAWSHILIEEGLYAKDFIEKNAHGFDELKQYLADKTPEWAYVETGLDPSLIRKSIRELAKNAPAAYVHPGRHVAWYGDDTQRSRAIAIVNALLGNWAKKGGFYLGNKLSLKAAKIPAFPPKAKFKSPSHFPLANKPCAYDVCDASLSTKERAATIKAWIVYGCNIPLTLPDTRKVIAAMKELEFVVAVDTMPAEVTSYADVVLPENTYLERYGELHAPLYRQPYVAIRQPAVKSMYQSKPGWWIAKSLADKLGLGHYFPYKDIESYLKSRMDNSGLSFDQLKKDGVILGDNLPIYDNAAQMQFNTPTGKIELLSTTLAAQKGLSAFPQYTRPEQVPDGFFRLLFGRSPVHTFSRTTNNPELLKVMPENEVWLNTDMARILGFKNGQYVMLENQDEVSTGPVRVFVTERIRQDCVYMVHGFGREDKRLRASYGKGASDARMVTRIKRDPIMGATGMNVNYVTLRKVG